MPGLQRDGEEDVTPAALLELQKDTPPGCCVFCQDPIPGYEKARRKPRMCKEPECQKSYHRLYDAERGQTGNRNNATPEQRRRYYEIRRDRNWAKGLTCHGKPAGTRSDLGRPRT